MNQGGSEDVLQRDLNLPRIARLTGDEAERRAVRVAVGPAPVRMVQLLYWFGSYLILSLVPRNGARMRGNMIMTNDTLRSI
jgi:hypothetical protein